MKKEKIKNIEENTKWLKRRWGKSKRFAFKGITFSWGYMISDSFLELPPLKFAEKILN